MFKFFQVLIAVALGYVVTATVSYFIIMKLSTNQHDRAIEAAMSAIFVFGPIGAVVAGVFMFVRSVH
jgi:cytochrome bd-type quinol oxidase subunit 2